MGRKMAHPIKYDEHMSLRPYMSKGSFGPTYSLYGVISHAGGGPNSGHYYAHIKDARGKWYEMNDESVSHHSGPPLVMKNAYILFYLKDKGQELDAAVGDVSTPVKAVKKTGIAAGMKRKKTIESDDEDDDASRPPPPSNGKFIGPLLSSPTIDIKPVEPRPDPQAELLKRKIAERQVPAIPTSPTKSTSPARAKPPSPVKPSAALQSLSQYADDDDSDDVGEKVEEKADSAKAAPEVPSPTLASPPPAAAKKLPPRLVTPPPSTPAKRPTSSGPIPVSSFYATTSQSSKRKDSESDRKRKTPEPEDSDGESSKASLSQYARTPLAQSSSVHRKATSDQWSLSSNPYSGSRMRSNLHGSPAIRQYGKRGRPRPRGL